MEQEFINCFDRIHARLDHLECSIDNLQCSIDKFEKKIDLILDHLKLTYPTEKHKS